MLASLCWKTPAKGRVLERVTFTAAVTNLPRLSLASPIPG
jgi:hypothetical protein